MAKNYIAKIEGEDSKWGFKRSFIWSGELRYDGNGELTVFKGDAINLEELPDGVYEIGNGWGNKYKDYVVVENGVVKDLNKEEALNFIKKAP